MNFLREVVARFGIQVDTTPLTEAEKNFDRVLSKVRSFAAGVTVAMGVAGLGMYNLVDAAGRAEDQLNVLRVAFGEKGMAEVVEWSKTVGKEIQRSEYFLQEFAGSFGAFLTPVFKGTEVDIQHMSKEMTKLAVDLASLYAMSDQEAAMSLKSGLSGETESVRKFGINVSDQRLQEMNIRDGGGSYASLTLAQKTALRYKAIMEDTTIAQGDAIRTAADWANQVRKVESQFMDIRVEIGKRLMPAAKSLIATFSNGIKEVGKWTKWLVDQTNLLETSLIAIGTILTTQVLSAALWQAALIPAGQFAVVMRAAFLEVTLLAGALITVFYLWEDIYTFFTDGDSVMGQFITKMTGLARPLDAFHLGVRRVKAVFDDIFTVVTNIARVMATLSTGGLYALFDKGVLDLKGKDFNPTAHLDAEDAKQVQELADRRSKFEQTVSSAKTDADLDAAAQQYGNQWMTPEEARKDAFNYRRELVVSGRIQATPADIAAGFANMSTPTGGAAQATAPVVNKTTVIQVNVEKAGATAEEIADQVSYTLDARNQSEEYMSGEY